MKERYRGYCRTCGADTSPRNGKGDAHLYCRRCRPGAAAPKWTRERVREAIRRWAQLYGAPPTSYDWSRTHARRRGAQAMRRLERGDWPAPATVSALFGSWAAASSSSARSGAKRLPRPLDLRRTCRSSAYRLWPRSVTGSRSRSTSVSNRCGESWRAHTTRSRFTVAPGRVADGQSEPVVIADLEQPTPATRGRAGRRFSVNGHHVGQLTHDKGAKAHTSTHQVSTGEVRGGREHRPLRASGLSTASRSRCPARCATRRVAHSSPATRVSLHPRPRRPTRHPQRDGDRDARLVGLLCVRRVPRVRPRRRGVLRLLDTRRTPQALPLAHDRGSAARAVPALPKTASASAPIAIALATLLIRPPTFSRVPTRGLPGLRAASGIPGDVVHRCQSRHPARSPAFRCRAPNADDDPLVNRARRRPRRVRVARTSGTSGGADGLHHVRLAVAVAAIPDDRAHPRRSPYALLASAGAPGAGLAARPSPIALGSLVGASPLALRPAHGSRSAIENADPGLVV